MSVIPSKDWERNDWSKSSKAVNNANLIEVPEELSVFSWGADPPGTVGMKCTQVHMHFKVPTIGTLMVRFKGPRTIDGLIAALQEHRENVWGKK